MIKVELSGDFDQKYRELVGGKEELKEIVSEKVRIFKGNPNDTRLSNHKLTGRMEGKWSFSIDRDLRIVYEWLGKNRVRFLAIGRHREVYSKPN